MIVYPYLPSGRTILLVPESNKFMAEAKRARLQFSTERNQPSGAVVVLDGQIIGRAANQSALKSVFLSNLHDNGWCVRHRLKIKTGTKYWLCPGCANYKLHSESRAVVDAQKNHGSAVGADLYLWGHWHCCWPCWQTMISAGIKNVYVTDDAHLRFHGSRHQIHKS